MTLFILISKNSLAQDLEDKVQDVLKVIKDKSGIISNDGNIKEASLDAIKDTISKINKPAKAKKKYDFKSLMFSDSEISEVKKVLNSKKIAKKKKESKDGNKKVETMREITTFGKIYLSSILYLSKDTWSIWVNSNKISSRDNSESDEIYIKSVTPYKVELVWSFSPSKWRIISGLPSNAVTPRLNSLGQIEINISLKSNQTYILKHDKVVNGKI
ncbi:hypothetical protein N9X24_00060 [Rickettsiales bacterium]|nr:hypothetical protein [Rickettsiales bacterium]